MTCYAALIILCHPGPDPAPGCTSPSDELSRRVRSERSPGITPEGTKSPGKPWRAGAAAAAAALSSAPGPGALSSVRYH